MNESPSNPGSTASRRRVWPDRHWQWSATRSEENFDSSEMLRRAAASGSLHWVGACDKNGAALDGGKTYKLTVPQPVPARRFWSITVYDTDKPSAFQAEESQGARRSRFELKSKNDVVPADFFFGPAPTPDHERTWIQTTPGTSWCACLRIYGPETPAFDGSWKPSDFEEVQPLEGRSPRVPN